MPPGQAQRKDSQFIIFENFRRMNTAEVRQGLPESDLAWVENLQPIENNNWTTVPGPGSTFVSINQTISSVYYGTLVINNVVTDYAVLFTTAGSAWAVNLATTTATKFAPDGTFSVTPGPDMTPYQQSRFLFNDPVSGYCSWDGTTFTRQGGLSANIGISNPGSNYTSPPSVTITGGSGSGATAVATIGTPSVIQVVLDNPGSGYNSASPPLISFTGGGGSNAAANVSSPNLVDPRAVSNLRFNPSGAIGEYVRFGGSVPPFNIAVSFSGGGGSGASAVCTTDINQAGHVFIKTLTLVTFGSGYTSVPTVVFTPDPAWWTGLGGAASATCDIGNGQITGNPTLTNGGTGYTSTPTVTIAAPGGGGTQATAHAVVGGAQVTKITLTNPGSGYLPGDKDISLGGTLQAIISAPGGGGTTAVAVLSVAPFLPKGTSVAVFGGRVWLNFFSGPNSTGPLNGLQWSGTGGYSDWSAGNLSGATVLSDADLVHQITGLRAFNNFLWIIGDQSIKQIGSIAVGQGIFAGTTVFTILTLSSDQGTTFLRSCVSFNRVFFFVNYNGIYAVFGSSVQKVSGPLDGIFKQVQFPAFINTGLPNANGLQPQGALVDMNNIHNVMWLLKVNDPTFTHTIRSLFAIFNGERWFLGSQGDAIKAVAHVCTVNTNWVPITTSGSDLTPVFYSPGTQVAVRLQTALSHHQNPVQRKKTVRLGYAMTLAAGTSPFSLQLDSDEASQPLPITLNAGFNLRTVADPNVSGTYLGWTIGGVVAGLTLTNLRIEYQETNIGNQN